jgi:DNA-binding transcriptional LysR family regulator
MKNNEILDLQALRVFASVAERGSFSAAAEALGLPKGRVSQLVQQLEARLGVRLLQRTTRRVQLMPDGEAVLERARGLLADAEELGGLFQRAPTELRGHLRLDLPVRLAVAQVLPALPQFLAAHPGLTLDLSSTDRRVNLIEEGFDCVLRVGSVGDDSLVARRLGVLRQLNLASPAYLARHGEPQHPRDLAEGHRLVHYAQRLPTRSPPVFEWLDESGQLQRQAMVAALSVNHTEAYEAAALAGLGLIQAPPSTGSQLHTGRLRAVMTSYEAPPLPVHLLWPQQRHLSRRTRALIDWLDGLLRPQLLQA